MINSLTPPAEGNEASKTSPEPPGGALYGHGGSVAGELGGLMTPSFSGLKGGGFEGAAPAPASGADTLSVKPARRSRGRPLLIAGFAFAALAVASGAVLLRPSPQTDPSNSFTPALKVRVDGAGSRPAQIAALAYAPTPHLSAADAGAPASAPEPSQSVPAAAPDGLRRSPSSDRSSPEGTQHRTKFALNAPEPRWLDRLADSDKPPLRMEPAPRAVETPSPEPVPRTATPAERRAAEPEAAPPRPRAAPSARGGDCGLDTDCPSYQAVMAADGKLRRAYAEAVEAGVPQYILLSLRRDWSDLRAGRAGQPADLVRGYERVAYELWRARQTALQRRESAGGWDDPDRRGDYR